MSEELSSNPRKVGDHFFVAGNDRLDSSAFYGYRVGEIYCSHVPMSVTGSVGTFMTDYMKKHGLEIIDSKNLLGNGYRLLLESQKLKLNERHDTRIKIYFGRDKVTVQPEYNNSDAVTLPSGVLSSKIGGLTGFLKIFEGGLESYKLPQKIGISQDSEVVMIDGEFAALLRSTK